MKTSIDLFENNSELFKKVKSLLDTISTQLADLNDFPINIVQYKSSKNPDFQEISKSMDELESLYILPLSKLSQNDLKQFVNAIHPQILWMAERYKGGGSISNIILELISWEVGRNFFNLDKYIDKNISQGKVFQTIKALEVYDKNLVKVNGKFKLERHGIIYDNDYLIYYHPLLRRFYTSNFTIGSWLQKVAAIKDIQLQLAIDQYRLSKPKYLKNIFEFDYWYGPHFSVEKLNDRNFTGVTVHKRIDKPISLVWQIDRTVFHISNKKEEGQKQIEIEEIVPNKDNGYSEKYVVQKYAHLIWDKNQNSFKHFDCAVRVYLKSEYEKRVLYDWNPNNVNAEAQTVQRLKLFRLDGIIEIELVMELLGDFFRYNELIYEFFSGQKMPEG